MNYAPLTPAEVEKLTCMQVGAPWAQPTLAALVEVISIYDKLRAEGKRPFDPADLPQAEHDAYWAGDSNPQPKGMQKPVATQCIVGQSCECQDGSKVCPRSVAPHAQVAVQTPETAQAIDTTALRELADAALLAAMKDGRHPNARNNEALGIARQDLFAAIDRLGATQAPAPAHDKTAWLIEVAQSPTLYWDGSLHSDHDVRRGESFVGPNMQPDPNRAVRFPTKELAQAAFDSFYTKVWPMPIRILGRDCYRIAEHMWPAAPSPAVGALTDAEVERLYRNSYESTVSLAAFCRIVRLTEGAHRIGDAQPPVQGNQP